MVHVSQEFLDHLNHFNSTKFKLDLQKKPFIYEIINLGEMLIGAIYDNWDNEFDYSGHVMLGVGVIASVAAIGLTYRFWDFIALDPAPI